MTKLKGKKWSKSQSRRKLQLKKKFQRRPVRSTNLVERDNEKGREKMPMRCVSEEPGWELLSKTESYQNTSWEHLWVRIASKDWEVFLKTKVQGSTSQETEREKDKTGRDKRQDFQERWKKRIRHQPQQSRKKDQNLKVKVLPLSMGLSIINFSGQTLTMTSSKI